MKITSIFSGNRAALAFFGVGFMMVGLAVDLAVTAYWWSYYYPWGIHFLYTAYATYILTLLCWVFASVSLIFLLIIIILYFSLSPIAENSTASKLLITLYSIFAILTCIVAIACAVLGLVRMHYDIDYYNVKKGRDDVYRLNMKCVGLLIYNLYEEPFEYAYEHQKANSYAKWVYKILNKVEKSITKDIKDDLINEIQNAVEENNSKIAEDFVDDYLATVDSRYKDDLCLNVGLPVLIFAIFLLIGLILFAIAACCCGGGRSPVAASY